LLAPSAPTNVEVISISSSQLDITWQPPFEHNGVIIGYNITWRMITNDLNESGDNLVNKLPSRLGASARNFSINNLGNF